MPGRVVSDPIRLSEHEHGTVYRFGDVEVRLITGPEAEFADAITGAIVVFKADSDTRCEGFVGWRRSKDDATHNRPTWTLVSSDPLTLDPSIQCPEHPEEHGHIRDGVWVPV